jgi:hypothetical protein
MSEIENIEITVANENHLKYIDTILETISVAAAKRGTGIAKRSHEYIKNKMLDGKAIIALNAEEFAGFCYIESWSDKQFVANSGLIVVEKYRGQGLAKAIKKKSFDISRQMFPNAKLFGLTTGLAVMKINSELGYRPVTFSELTQDKDFWKGCEACVNFDILTRNSNKMCLCTGMLYDPVEHVSSAKKQTAWKKVFARLFPKQVRNQVKKLVPKHDAMTKSH